VISADDQLTLTFIDMEILGSTTAIIGLTLFILASFTSRNILLRAYTHSGLSLRNPSYVPAILNPDLITVVGRILLVSASLLASITTTMRFFQRATRIKRNEPMGGTLVPITFVTFGSWITFPDPS
jgi:hypothetical protein